MFYFNDKLIISVDESLFNTILFLVSEDDDEFFVKFSNYEDDNDEYFEYYYD